MSRTGKKAASAPARAANPVRGEHSLTLSGQRFVLRPSFQAQVGIETATGKSYMDLARAANGGSLHIRDAAIITAELINAAAGDDALDRVSVDRIGDMIYETGLPGVAAVLAVTMIDALTGGRTASGEAKAVA